MSFAWLARNNRGACSSSQFSRFNTAENFRTFCHFFARRNTRSLLSFILPLELLATTDDYLFENTIKTTSILFSQLVSPVLFSFLFIFSAASLYLHFFSNCCTYWTVHSRYPILSCRKAISISRVTRIREAMLVIRTSNGEMAMFSFSSTANVLKS